MIHKYKLNGYNIVLDVNSGGVYVVDDLTYDLLDNVMPPFAEECPENVLEKLSKYYHPLEVAECYKEIVELAKNDILFSSEEGYEKFTNFSVISPVKAMCLLVSQDCNMRCKYCFASTGDFGMGKRMLMDFETGKKAIDFLLENSGNRENLELDFFGGEPLMNFKVVKQIVEYARSREAEYKKRFRFTITTNGLLLNDDIVDFINKEMSNVVLSIDGRREVNDRMRPLVGGKGSYDIIVDKYKNLVNKRGHKNYYVRGTFTKYNLDFSDDVFDMYDNGFREISIEPVVTDHCQPYALTESELPKVFMEYEKLADRILENDKAGKHFNFFHFMMDLDQGPCVIKRLRGCGCGNDYVAISPEGDIYPCHQFVGMDEWHMGNINDGTFNKEMKSYFAKTHIYTKPECKNCWAKFYCSGGCNANNYIYAGDVHTPYKLSCEMEKKRLECAIMIKAVRNAWAEEEAEKNAELQQG